jgi:hypothetical protein
MCVTLWMISNRHNLLAHIALPSKLAWGEPEKSSRLLLCS